MKTFLTSLVGSLVGIILFVVLVGGGILIKTQQKSKIEDNSWLVIDLYGEILEYNPPTDLMGQVMGGSPETLTRILGNLEKAANDDRIDGVLLKVASNGTGFADKQEIRGAIKGVQAAGKKVYGFSDSFDRGTYYTLAACDKIYSPPAAYIGFVGVALTAPFVKGTLEKLGIKPNLHKIKDYKAAAELVTRTDMSDEFKENQNWMLDDFWDTFVANMEADRGLSEAQLLGIMERASLSAKTAVEVGLIDEIKYWDEIEDMLKGDEDELNTVGMARYAEVERKRVGIKGKETIAVIHAQGDIGGRNSRVDPLLGVMMGHETVVADLRRAREDEDVKAIIFRVNSGGGESLASDLIGHEIERCAAVKPTICSMVNVAASGGYDIAYRASKILVLPATVTGSIGSISGKFNMKEFWEKLGISHDGISRGPNARMWSSLQDFTEDEWEIHREEHWESFNRWLAQVAEKRGMSFEEAEALAHGRVWTGNQAVENGLADELGGFDRAIELAKELAEIPAEDDVKLAHYPVEQDIFEALTGGGDMAMAVNWIVYRWVHEDLAETWRLVSEHGLLETSVPMLR